MCHYNLDTTLLTPMVHYKTPYPFRRHDFLIRQLKQMIRRVHRRERLKEFKGPLAISTLRLRLSFLLLIIRQTPTVSGAEGAHGPDNVRKQK